MVYPNNTKKPVNKKKVGSLVLAIIVVLIVIILAATAFVTVPSGHTGVVVTMGKVSDRILPEGLHFKLPWQNVIKVDNRAQKASLSTQAFSSDIQQVDVNVSVNYSVDPARSQYLYQNVGTQYYNTVMLPRIMENVKSIFSKYSADNLVVNRETLAPQIMELLEPEMTRYGIQVLNVAIEDVDFTDAFTEAVEAKQVAEQTKLKSEIEQDEKLMVEQKTAERVVIAAEADASVVKINADAAAYTQRVRAEAEAEANKLIAQSVTPELIEYVKANGWDGMLPKLFAGSDSSVLPIIGTEDLLGE